MEFSGDIKELYGESAFALDTARGKIKISGKAKTGLIDLNLYNSLFFGQTVVPGQTLAAFNELASVPGSSTYTVTVANAATFLRNLAVYYASTGVKLTQVAPGSEATGKYSVSGVGVYTFVVGDASAALVFNYEYTVASATGFRIAGTNVLMGTIPQFQMNLANVFKGKTQELTLYCCVSSKLSLPFKQDDYEVPEIDFMAQDNGAGLVFDWSATMG